MTHIVTCVLLTLLYGAGALTLIKRGIAGPFEKVSTYNGSDVLAGCIVLALLAVAWLS